MTLVVRRCLWPDDEDCLHAGGDLTCTVLLVLVGENLRASDFIMLFSYQQYGLVFEES